ncbi:BTAD domain-containing putative transcriptional regulator [Actinoplanes sp. NPDC026670]|uniref:BTAD domain-containing putative transcriptional regulator n=1 Tax=Actinoplanes sp. NPDC026670 TaxID=3154700 RepID=UPI0033F8C34D
MGVEPGMDDSSSAGVLRFEMLGPIRAFRGSEPVDLGPPKQQAVLALLLLQAPRPVPLDRIVATLWNGDPPPNGVDVVQRFIGALRRSLDPERTSLITLTDGGYVIRAGENAVDTGMFRAALARAQAEHQTGAIGAATDEIRTALGMWQDEPFTGLSGPVFESARARLNSERAAASALLADPTAVAPTSPAAPNPAPLAATRPFSPPAPSAAPAAPPATRPFSPPAPSAAPAAPPATRPFSAPEPAASPLPATRPFSPAEPPASPLPATRPFSPASPPAATRPISPSPPHSASPPHPPSPPHSPSPPPKPPVTASKPPLAKPEPEKSAYPEAVDPWEGHDLFPPDPLSMS